MTDAKKVRPTIATRHRGVELLGIILVVVALSFVRIQADVYSVCSDSESIYTVDESNPTVRCITVQGSRITGAGSLGACH